MQEFLSQILPYAQQASQQTGIDPRIIAAQAALESGWGKSAPGGNYFGIKSHGKPGGQTLRTTENVGGQNVSINDSFRKYGGMGDSVKGYAEFMMNNPRYKPMREAQDIDSQIDALQASGYATDPKYGQKIRSIVGRIDGDYTPNTRINNAFSDAGGGPMKRYNDFSGPPGLANAPRKQEGGGVRGFLKDNRGALMGLGAELLARGLDTRNRFTGAGLMAGAQGDQGRRDKATEREQQNAAHRATSQFLQSNGAPPELVQLSQAPGMGGKAMDIWASLQKGDSTTAMKNYQLATQDPKFAEFLNAPKPLGPLGQAQLEGAKLSNEKSRRELSQPPMLDAPKVQKQTLADGSERLVQWDGTSGPEGAWVPLNAPEGGANIQNVKDLTESQSKLALFNQMQQDAAPIIDGLEERYNPANIADAAARNTPIAGNYFQSAEGQQYNAAANVWSEGALRIATGAAAQQQEIDRVRSTYFAQIGDLPETVQFKARLRKMYQRAIEAAQGKPVKPLEFAEKNATGTANTSGAIKIPENIGEEVTMPNGMIMRRTK